MIGTTTIGTDALLDLGFRDGTGESPNWDADRRVWIWIDQPGRLVRRLDPASGAARSWRLAEAVGAMVGSLVLRADGGLLCGGVAGLFDVDLPEESADALCTPVAAIEHPKPGMRFNDGRCDRQGRLWVSTMVGDIALGDPAGRWHRYTRADGLTATGLDGFVIPNGSAFSPDGRTVYASDSHRDVRMVWAWDYDPDEGRASNRRVFADMRAMVGRPDGAAIDTDGGYWIGCLDEGCVKRFTPDGRLDRRIEVPMRKPTMVAFGGDDRRTMMVASLCRGPADLAEDPHGGRVALFRPGAQGMPEPRFAP